MKVVLIDDEQPALDYLEYHLKKITDFEIIGKYTDPFEGKSVIEKEEIDLVFLDIQIPNLNGIELAEQLLEKKPTLPIVFVTAYDEYAIKAFELNAMDYILKPISSSRLLKTIKRIENKTYYENIHSSESPEQLSLQLFNNFSLKEHTDNEEVIIPLKWRTAKTEQLFLYLIQHEGQVIHKDVIVELLWPDVHPNKSFNQLYTTIYNIRKELGAYDHHFELKSVSNGYILLLTDVIVDAKQFELMTDKKITLSDKNIQAYEQILSIFTGDYLKSYDYLWADAIREKLRIKWLKLAYQVARWYFEQEELKQSFDVCYEIHLRYPLEEDAHFLMMQIHDKMENYSAVRSQYGKLTEVLLSELQISPKPKITEWYKEWEQTKIGLLK